METTERKKPMVGLALSGASSRSVFYIGFLEKLQENNFPIDFISAMSGAAVVAASFSSGTLNKLKKFSLELDKEVVFSLIEKSSSSTGLYSLAKTEEFLRNFTENKRFEEVSPRLGIVTTDINSGEEVVLQIGDIAKAVCASCAMPGIFEPLQWGHMTLIDGGVLNVVPGNVVRNAGADLIIGVDMRSNRHVFSPWQIKVKRVSNYLKKLFMAKQVGQLWTRLIQLLDYPEFFQNYPPTEELQPNQKYPKMFSVIGRSLDLAIEAQQKPQDDNFNSDILIVPRNRPIPFWKKYLYTHFTDFSHTGYYYKLGQETATEYLPKLWQALADLEQKQIQTDNKLSEIKEANTHELN